MTDKAYTITATVTRTVKLSITATSEEEALRKFRDGESDDEIELDQTDFDLNEDTLVCEGALDDEGDEAEGEEGDTFDRAADSFDENTKD